MTETGIINNDGRNRSDRTGIRRSENDSTSRKHMKPEESSNRKEMITAEGNTKQMREREANPTPSWKMKRSEGKRER